MDLNYANYETRNGVLPISWQDFHGLCRGLALAAAPFHPEMVLGIARGGLYAGTLVSHLLRQDFAAIYLTRRHLDVKVSEEPEWRVRPPDEVRGKRVLVVDEICSVGVTLRMAKEELFRMGAEKVHCAVLYAHSWGTETPDYIGLVSDALILNPWDRETVQDGLIVFNPEYVYALDLQQVPPGSILPMKGVDTIRPVKTPGET